MFVVPLNPCSKREWLAGGRQTFFAPSRQRSCKHRRGRKGGQITAWQGGGSGVLGDVVRAIHHGHSAPERIVGQFKNRPGQFIAITPEDEVVINRFLAKRPIHAWVA